MFKKLPLNDRSDRYLEVTGPGRTPRSPASSNTLQLLLREEVYLAALTENSFLICHPPAQSLQNNYEIKIHFQPRGTFNPFSFKSVVSGLELTFLQAANCSNESWLQKPTEHSCSQTRHPPLHDSIWRLWLWRPQTGSETMNSAGASCKLVYRPKWKSTQIFIFIKPADACFCTLFIHTSQKMWNWVKVGLLSDTPPFVKHTNPV